MPRLPAAFFDAPIAHRALHDGNVTRAENNLRAIDAAIAAGYGIEIDLQLSADGEAMVFHDYALEHLTESKGAFARHTTADLRKLRFHTGEIGVPTLKTVLKHVAGRVPLLIEIKDQDGAMGPNVGLLESATARALAGYDGPVALMSFNPHSVAHCATLCPNIPRGLTTCDWADKEDQLIPAARRDDLREIGDFDRVGATFLSHQWDDLTRPRVIALQKAGADILCWTVKSPKAEIKAREVAQNITFEGYTPT